MLEESPIYISRQDVEILNSFQALGASELLLAKSEGMSRRLELLGTRYADKSAFTSYAANSEPTDKGGGNLRSTHIVVRRQTPVPLMPSLVKVKNRVRRKPIDCRHRQPDVVLAHEAFTKELDHKRRANAP